MAVDMPGKSFQGPLPELTVAQQSLRDRLEAHNRQLALEIGERNAYRRPAQLQQTVEYLDQSLAPAGTVGRQTFTASGVKCHNLEVMLTGTVRPQESVVVGAHYDTVAHCPGANDNGSGVAALLALAELLAEFKPERTLRFVAFANEESPYYRTSQMGSLVYARRLRARGDKITAMLSLETIGYFSDVQGSQKYPPPLSRYYPSTGNFIGFVGNVQSAALVRQAVAAFRRHAKFPSEGGALPAHIDGVGWSDHWSFWQQGYPALMVTDTAPFRYPHYHRHTDTPDKLDFARMARVVDGLRHVIVELTTVPSE